MHHDVFCLLIIIIIVLLHCCSRDCSRDCSGDVSGDSSRDSHNSSSTDRNHGVLHWALRLRWLQWPGLVLLLTLSLLLLLQKCRRRRCSCCSSDMALDVLRCYPEAALGPCYDALHSTQHRREDMGRDFMVPLLSNSKVPKQLSTLVHGLARFLLCVVPVRWQGRQATGRQANKSTPVSRDITIVLEDSHMTFDPRPGLGCACSRQ